MKPLSTPPNTLALLCLAVLLCDPVSSVVRVSPAEVCNFFHPVPVPLNALHFPPSCHWALPRKQRLAREDIDIPHELPLPQGSHLVSFPFLLPACQPCASPNPHGSPLLSWPRGPVSHVRSGSRFGRQSLRHHAVRRPLAELRQRSRRRRC